jgi:hypothetical protein
METFFTVLKKAKKGFLVTYKKTPTSVGVCDLTDSTIPVSPLKWVVIIFV